METKTMYAIFALGVIALLGTSFVFAYQGNPSLTRPDYSDERHAAMEEAFENTDYFAWLELMQSVEHPHQARVLEVVTEENFALFAKMHEAMEDGDFETAQEIREELGFGQGKIGQGNGKGLRDGTHLGLRDGSMRGQGKGMHLGQGQYENCPYAN